MQSRENSVFRPQFMYKGCDLIFHLRPSKHYCASIFATCRHVDNLPMAAPVSFDNQRFWIPPASSQVRSANDKRSPSALQRPSIPVDGSETTHAPPPPPSGFISDFQAARSNVIISISSDEEFDMDKNVNEGSRESLVRNPGFAVTEGAVHLGHAESRYETRLHTGSESEDELGKFPDEARPTATEETLNESASFDTECMAGVADVVCEQSSRPFDFQRPLSSTYDVEGPAGASFAPDLPVIDPEGTALSVELSSLSDPARQTGGHDCSHPRIPATAVERRQGIDVLDAVSVRLPRGIIQSSSPVTSAVSTMFPPPWRTLSRSTLASSPLSSSAEALRGGSTASSLASAQSPDASELDPTSSEETDCRSEAGSRLACGRRRNRGRTLRNGLHGLDRAYPLGHYNSCTKSDAEYHPPAPHDEHEDSGSQGGNEDEAAQLGSRKRRRLSEPSVHRKQCRLRKSVNAHQSRSSLVADDAEIGQAVSDEWPLQGAVLKRTIVNGRARFQLQFELGRCVEGGHGSHQKFGRNFKKPAGAAKRTTITRARFTPDEDELIKKLKERGLSWAQIHRDFCTTFTGRSQETLQVRYCTKLKSRG